MFNEKMTQNNFYPIIILIHIKIYHAAAKRGFFHYFNLKVENDLKPTYKLHNKHVIMNNISDTNSN